MNEVSPGYIWVRICQECSAMNKARKPAGPTDRYLNASCRRCKSPALDYGRELLETLYVD